MEPLKLGDWITVSGPAGQFVEQISNINTDTYTLRKSAICYKSQATKWIPEQGEWCWFFNKDRIPTISQFVEFHDDINKYFATYPNKPNSLGSYYTHCEPFIGELPSILKDL